MKNQPLVSICVPAYNSAEFLEKTLQSIINQSYRNIEIIIVDDCSKDKTSQIIRLIHDDRINYVKNSVNLGVEKNWNKTLQLANGKYCKVMGADDIIYPSIIEEQVGILEDKQYADVVLVTSHKHVIDQDDVLVLTRKFPGKGRIEGLKAVKMSLIRGANVIGEPVAGLFRREALEKSGLYNGENLYMIDLDQWSRILKHGDLYVIDSVLYAFRISTNSLSSSLGFAQVGLFNMFVDKLYSDKTFHINRFEKIVAKTMSLAMGIARNLVYFAYFRKF
jgi:glycosyltransferase involved in cell wall biosynthesis